MPSYRTTHGRTLTLCLCGITSPDRDGNRDLIEHPDCPIHAPELTPARGRGGSRNHPHKPADRRVAQFKEDPIPIGMVGKALSTGLVGNDG